jgi:hypothetical protein
MSAPPLIGSSRQWCRQGVVVAVAKASLVDGPDTPWNPTCVVTTEPATSVQTAYADVVVPPPRAEPEVAAADHDPSVLAVPDTGLPTASLG